MRMWMMKPELYCRPHLIASHSELHTLVGSIKKRISLRGYVDKNLLEARSIFWYHDLCVEEMLKRGYNHNSPLEQIKLEDYISDPYVLESTVNKPFALRILLLRCPDCSSNYEKLYGSVEDFLASIR